MAVSISSTPPRERRTILEGIVDVIIPNHFNDGSVSGKNNGACGGKISSSGSNSGSASSDPYGAAPSSSFLMASLVAPEVIAERFTPAAARDLDSAYLRQFENAFDLFLMQNPALVPGNADTVERLKNSSPESEHRAGEAGGGTDEAAEMDHREQGDDGEGDEGEVD